MRFSSKTPLPTHTHTHSHTHTHTGSCSLPGNQSSVLVTADCCLGQKHPRLCPGGVASHFLQERVWCQFSTLWHSCRSVSDLWRRAWVLSRWIYIRQVCVCVCGEGGCAWRRAGVLSQWIYISDRSVYVCVCVGGGVMQFCVYYGFCFMCKFSPLLSLLSLLSLLLSLLSLLPPFPFSSFLLFFPLSLPFLPFLPPIPPSDFPPDGRMQRPM